MKTLHHLVLPCLRTCLSLLLLTTLASPGLAATDLATQKLFGRWSLTPTDYHLGGEVNSAALSSKWIVVGAFGAAERGQANEGGVQVYNAVTGAWVRKLLPPLPAAPNQKFGCAVAISGDIAVVGAYATNSNQGRAYLYNLATGKLLKTLVASDGAANNNFGANVAISGNTAFVGAWGNQSFRGAVYLYNVSTGAEIVKLQAADSAVTNFFGDGLAVEGSILAVGADGAEGNKGAVYFYDISNLAVPLLIKKFTPSGAVAGDFSCYTLGMSQGRVVMGMYNSGKAFLHDLNSGLDVVLTVGGASNSFGRTVAIDGPIIAVSEYAANGNVGRVHLFKSSDGSFLRTIVPPNGDTASVQFGRVLALDGTTLLATAPDDGVQASNAGAVHLIGPLTQDMSFTKVVAKGDFAPGAPDISYGTIGDVFINPDGETLFSSSLTGAGSNRSRDMGVFSDVAVAGAQQLLFKTRQTYSGTAVFGTPSQLTMNDFDLAVGLSTLTGGGVTSLNNRLLWAKTNVSQLTLMRTGTAFATTALTGTVPKSILEPVTGNQGTQKLMGAYCTLRVGTGGATAANDSALYLAKVGTSEETVREGDLTPAFMPFGSLLGQIAPRLAIQYNRFVFSTALTGTSITTANNAAVFNKAFGFAPTLVVQKGDTASDGTGAAMPGVTYSTFIGESCPNDYGEVYRATLKGTGVTTANNDGVWAVPSFHPRRLAFRKGQTLTPLPGLKLAKIISFWATGLNSADVQCIALVKLSGPGVNSANDQALLLWQTDGSINVLMREGDPAPGCKDAKIGVISRVESDAYLMSYAVLATLTGPSTSGNLALFTGNVNRGDTVDMAALRRPFLRLRKGQLYDNQPSKIKSISLPTTTITAAGAGSTGRGHAIAWSGVLAFIVEFDNGVRQIVKGRVD